MWKWGSDMQRRGGVALQILSYSSFLKHPMKIKSFGLSKTKLFDFHGIFKKTGAGGWGSSEPPEPPLDPPQRARMRHFIRVYTVC